MSKDTKLFQNEYMVILSIFLGALFGLYFKDIASHFYFMGDLYLRLLQLAVIPLVIFTISKSIYELNSSSTKLVSRAGIVAVIVTLLFVAISILLTIIASPWDYIKNISDFNTLFTNLSSTQPVELTSLDRFESSMNSSLVNFVITSVPPNIFNAINEGNMVQIVFVSMFVTYFMYKTFKREKNEEKLKVFLNYGYDIFSQLNDFVVSLMPVGAFFLISNQFLKLDVQSLSALVVLAFTIIMCLTTLIFISIVVSCYKYNISPYKFFTIFYETTLIILTTRSQIVAMPSTLRGMEELKADNSLVKVYMPLGLSVLRVGTMSFFAIVVLFVMGIFDISITWDKILFILIGCSVAGMATVGTTGIIALQLISIVLEPLGLPFEGVMAILIVVDAIVDIFDTYLNFTINVMISALVDKKVK